MSKVTNTIMSSTDRGGSLEDLVPLLPPPCLICGNIFVKTERAEVNIERDEDESRLDLHRNVDSDRLLQHFLTLFGINLEGEEVPNEWNGEGDRDLIGERGEQVRFCHLCKHRVQLLMELQRKLEEITEQLRNGREELIEIVESSEESVQEEGIYKINKKYLRIRTQFLGSSKIQSTPSPCRIPDFDLKLDKKLSAVGTRNNPFVQLSASDRIRAETFKREPTLEERTTLKSGEFEDNSLYGCEDDDFGADHVSNSSKYSSDVDYGATPKRKLKTKTAAKKGRQQETRREGGGGHSTNQNAGDKSDELSLPPKKPKRGRPRKLKKHIKPTTRRTENAEDLVRSRKYSKPHPDIIALEADESSTEFHRIIKNHNVKKYEYSIDPATGNYTYINVTLTKLATSEDGKEQYQCTLCSKILILRSDPHNVNMNIKRHVLKWHSKTKRKYLCKHCGKEFANSHGARLHIENVHERRTFTCSICGKPLKSEGNLKQHKLTHLSEEEKETLRESREGIGNQEKVQCELCGVYVRKYSLREHTAGVHGGGDEGKGRHKKEQVMCPQCGKCVVSLRSHLLISHSTGRHFPCIVCEKRFKSSSELRYHTKSVHDRDNFRFKCDICKKSFYRRKQLEDHTRVHLKTKSVKE